MFWDSVCPSSTGNTLSSTNWLSPLLGGHCCLRSSIQKFKKVVHILCSPRQRPGSQGIIFRVRLIWRHKAYMKGWKQVTIPFLLSDGFQSFIKLLHTREREREREKYKLAKKIVLSVHRVYSNVPIWLLIITITKFSNLIGSQLPWFQP